MTATNRKATATATKATKQSQPMKTTKATATKATKATKATCGILHETSDFVVIATSGSTNRKTGTAIQIWILDATMHPVESRRTGNDSRNQCAGCPLASGQGCYVTTNPLSAIYRKWKAGGYQYLTAGTPEFTALFSGQFVRFGAYGNPSKMPLPLVETIANLARRHTGYFHDWHMMNKETAQAYGAFFMASCEPNTWQAAQAMGLRTFTTCTQPEDVRGAGIECLADSHGMQCNQCGLCDGTRRKASLPSVFIKVHGFQTNKAASRIA